jgi:hypothetical protein
VLSREVQERRAAVTLLLRRFTLTDEEVQNRTLTLKAVVCEAVH